MTASTGIKQPNTIITRKEILNKEVPILELSQFDVLNVDFELVSYPEARSSIIPPESSGSILISDSSVLGSIGMMEFIAPDL